MQKKKDSIRQILRNGDEIKFSFNDLKTRGCIEVRRYGQTRFKFVSDGSYMPVKKLFEEACFNDANTKGMY